MAVSNVTPPAISGQSVQGKTYVASTGTWTSTDPLVFAYQWRRCDADGLNCVDIAGATQNSYLLSAADVGKRHRVKVTATESTPIGGDELTWAPPTAGAGGVAVVNFTLTNATRQSATLGSGGGRDLVISQTEKLTGPVAQITGWRHVLWIGGEIEITSPANSTAVIFRSCTGTVHVEGLYVHGAGVGDAIVVRLGGSGQIVQIQKSRLEVNQQSGFHADGLQSQGGVMAGLRFDSMTFVTNYQGTFLRNSYGDNPAADISNVEYKRVNFKGGGANYFWQTWEDKDATTPARAITPVTLHGDTVWMAGGLNATPGRWLFPNSIFEDGFGGGTATMRRGCFVDTDGTSDFIRFSTGAETVPGGGPKSGQATLDCQIAGKIRVGAPPGGDYCPAADVLQGAYTSPGYL